MKLIDIFILIINLLVTSLGSVILKIGANKVNKKEKLLYVFGGLFIYFAMSIITIYLYSKYSLVLVQGTLALTYIVSPIMANLILKESLPKKIWLVLLTIVIGIILISIGDSRLE